LQKRERKLLLIGKGVEESRKMRDDESTMEGGRKLQDYSSESERDGEPSRVRPSGLRHSAATQSCATELGAGWPSPATKGLKKTRNEACFRRAGSQLQRMN